MAEDRPIFVMPHRPLPTDTIPQARNKIADNLDSISGWIERLIEDHAHMTCEHIDGELAAGAESIRRFADEVRPGGTFQPGATTEQQEPQSDS